MLESIYVGMTGLLGYSRGLRVIANNTANLNTPGFKSSSLQFTDLFYTGGNLSGGNTGANQAQNQLGFGLNTAGTSISFKQGELRQTGNDLDMAVDGQGLFVLQNADGKVSYTRAGQFKFDTDGMLVNRVGGEKVMALGEGDAFVPITLAGQMMNPGKTTTKLTFTGTVPASGTDALVVGGLQVIDASGQSHALTMKLYQATSTPEGMSVKVEILDGTVVIATNALVFSDGKPVAATARIPVTYSPAGQPPMALTLDFGTDVVLFSGGTQIKMASQDGVAPGTLSGAVFDETGTLRMTYTNGQTVKGARLALARFSSPDAVESLGGNQFDVLDKSAWRLGSAGEGAFGKIASGRVEISNVDLSQEFSDLVIMQRGYQASSQVISTANEMLQQLFSMKSK